MKYNGTANSTALHIAAYRGHLHTVSVIIRHSRATVNARVC